jgi:hypothetical protein
MGEGRRLCSQPAQRLAKHPTGAQRNWRLQRTMKYLLVFIAITMLLLPSFEIFAQQGTPEPSTGTREAAADVAYWVAYWAKPKVVIFGPEEDAF